MDTARNHRWIMSPIHDFILFLPAVWGLTVLLAAALRPDFSQAMLPWRTLSFINSVHTGLPIAYAIFFMRDLKRAQSIRLFVGTAILFLTSIGFYQLGKVNLIFLTLILPTLFVLAATYHFYRQDLGVCSMYRSLDATKTAREVSFERNLIFFLAFVGPNLHWLETGSRYYAFLDWVGSLQQVFWYLVPVKWIGLACGIFYLAYQVIYKRNFSPRFLYIGGIVVFYATMTAFEFILYATIIQYIARIFTHDWVEIGFQGKLLREEFRTGKPSAWIKIALCMLLTAAITYFFTYSKQTYSFMTLIQQSGYVDRTKLANLLHDTGFEIWAISYFFLSACHYYIGRYVYDFSRPEIRRKLSFGGTK
jgi:hypothetical protein